MNLLEDDLCQARIAFHGRIVADATHEIQNHFAVIKEYNGLIGDLLQSQQHDMDSCVRRCLVITGNINERARLAADMVDILNRFTHRGDTARSLFRVEEVVEDLVSLLQRSASQHRISLEASHGRNVPEVSSDASLLQFLVYSLTSPLIEALPENGRISISTERGKGKIPQVTLTSQGGAPSLMEHELMEPELMSACLSRLNGIFSADDAGRKGKKLTLSIPSHS
ncbi:MAG: sensor histidine kinase [Thermoleophilia bacterium]